MRAHSNEHRHAGQNVHSPRGRNARGFADGSEARAAGQGGSGRGFSLIEFVVVIVLMAIIFATGGRAIFSLFSAFETERDIMRADWQGIIALERLTRDLRTIRSPSTADLTIAPATQITFVDETGARVQYFLNGSALTRSVSAGASPLADNISDLQFYYLQENGQTVAAAAANVSYITVRLRVIDGDYIETLRATVHPRGF